MPLTVDECTFLYQDDRYYVVTTDGILQLHMGNSIIDIDTNVRSIESSDYYIKEDHTLWTHTIRDETMVGDAERSFSVETSKVMDNVAMFRMWWVDSHIDNRFFVITTDRTLWVWGDDVYTPEEITGSVVDIRLGRTGLDKNANRIETYFVLLSDGSLSDFDMYDLSFNYMGENIYPYPEMEVTAFSTTDWGFYWIDGNGALGRKGGLWRNDEYGDYTVTISDKDVIKFFPHEETGYGELFDNVHFIKSDNTLWGHGRNTHGELGDGTKIPREKETVKIAGDVYSVYPYAYLKTNGELWAWTDKNPTPEKKCDSVASIRIKNNGNDENQLVFFQDGQMYYIAGRMDFADVARWDCLNGDPLYADLILDNVKIPRTLSFNTDGTYEVMNPIG